MKEKKYVIIEFSKIFSDIEFGHNSIQLGVEVGSIIGQLE